MLLITRPCPFLERKRAISATEDEEDRSDQPCGSADTHNEASSLSNSIYAITKTNEECESPLHSGIRIKSDGKYEVYVDGKLFADKSTRTAAAATQKSVPDVRPIFSNFYKAKCGLRNLFSRCQRVTHPRLFVSALVALAEEMVE